MTGAGSADEQALTARMEAADRRMADADALLDIASAQLSVAARNIADAHAAEREYRRATWHYTRLARHRLAAPLEAIVGMADTLRDMPDLAQPQRVALAESIAEQARRLRQECLREPDAVDAPRAVRPSPLTDAVRALGPKRPERDGSHEPAEPTSLSRFRRERAVDPPSRS